MTGKLRSIAPQVAFAMVLFCLAVGRPALADPIAPYVPPVPTVFDPPAGAGKVYLASPDLPPGYGEREYLIRGKANLYEHSTDGALVVRQPDQTYTTRVLVRYPRDRSRFSGVVIFDLLHPEIGSESLWSFGRDYITRSGDAYIQVTTRREPRNPLVPGPPSTPPDRLMSFDPVRYAAIDFRDGGLTWDIISQVGRLIKTDSPANPLRSYRPRQTIVGGWSGAGALTLFYVNEGFHQRAQMPDGSHIFDAYLVGEPSWYPRVNSKVSPAADMPDLDPRQKVKARDVPAISLYSMASANRPDRHGMLLGRQRPDSDDPNDRYRTYVVAGAYHAGRLKGLPELAERKCDHPPSTTPLDHYFALSLDHLKRWSRGGFTPPYAAPLALEADGTPKFDADRNPVGGLRSPALDAPFASHFANGGAAGCDIRGAQVAFTPERLRRLYGSKAAYLTRVKALADELVVQGWLLPEDAREDVAIAEMVDFGS